MNFVSQDITEQIEQIRFQKRIESTKTKNSRDRRTSSARLSGSRSTKISPNGTEKLSRYHTKSFGTKITSLGLDGTIISDYVGRVSESQIDRP